MKKFKHALIIKSLGLLLISTSVYAGDFYLGAAYAEFDIDLETSLGDLSAEPDGINIFFGKRLNKHLALEGNVVSGISDDRIDRTFSSKYKIKYTAGVSALGILPVTEQIGVYGRLGLIKAKFDDSEGDKSDADGVSYGVGAYADISDHFGVNLDYIVYPDGDYKDFNIDIEAKIISLGVYTRF